MLSEDARKNKVNYNIQRNKNLTNLFCARLPKEEYTMMCDYLKSIGMNKAEFVRWAFDKIREN